MNNLHDNRKAFVINTLLAAAGNVVKSVERDQLQITDGGHLLFAVPLNATAKFFPYSAEARQVVKFTIGTLVAGKTYVLLREKSSSNAIGRDRNYYLNTGRYRYTTPAVIADNATEVGKMIDSFIAQIAADVNSYAVGTKTGAGSNELTVTENAGYGMVASYMCPQNWAILADNAEVTTAITTVGKTAMGNGNVMLKQLPTRNIWGDGVINNIGNEGYNFDSWNLPLGGKTYDLYVISFFSNLKNHSGAVPQMQSNLNLYVDSASVADDIAAFKTALGIS